MGVPMICMPYLGDQRGNGKYVEHVWHDGLTLGGVLERGEVEAAIRRLMWSQEGNKNTDMLDLRFVFSHTPSVP